MNVGISCNALGYSGGSERYAMDLVRGLHERDIRPVFFAKMVDKALPEYRQVKAVALPTRKLPGKLNDHAFGWLVRYLAKREHIDLMIGCNRTGASDIAICGGTHVGYLKSFSKEAAFWDRQQIALERRDYVRSHVVVAHSRLMAQEVLDYYDIPAAKVKTVYPPVSETKFSPVGEAERQRLRDELGFAKDRVTFVFPSSSHKRKGYPLLEAFFSKTDLPVQLAVIGRPVSSSSPNIRYLGYRKDIENVYRAADYTILASHYEPFGLIGVESVLCGTPAVLAANIACTEVISEEGAPTFDLSDPATLARTIEAAVARAQAGQARLANPREHLRYDPSIAAHIDALLALAPGAGTLR